MPFIGRDWRSPGEAWVKTENLGWQRMKIIESQLHPGCHQYHNLACSWPPPSQIGQHMANNCGNANSCGHIGSVETSARSDNEVEGDLPSQSGGARALPASSPERTSPHHLHPITISSPYGRYSCCGHHLQQTQDSRPARLHCCKRGQGFTNQHHHDEQQHQMSRSLSRDSFETSDSPTGCSNNSQTMRYNNSFSDLRSSTGSRSMHVNEVAPVERSMRQSSRSQVRPFELETPTSSPVESDQDKRNNLQAPLITKNGVELHDGDSSSRKDSWEASKEDAVSRQQRSRSVSPQCCCCCRRSHLSPVQAAPSNFQANFIEQPMAAPHCRVSVKTREVAMYNTISEAFYRLDFYNAIHDIRRFNYICKLLHLLVTQNLTSLSGCATKVLFTMLEQVAWEVSSNKRNIHVIKNLLDGLKESIRKYYCWGRPIGSSVLWQQHFDTIERISRIVDGIELSQVTFDKLPAEMVREILLRLNDYRDLVNSAQASPMMRNMIDEQYIWHKLCRYHFTEQQVNLVFENSSYLSRVKRSTLRGIKFARTVSADGKISYRNPVAHKRLSGRSSAKSDCHRDSDCRQQQRNGSHGWRSSSSSDSDGSPGEPTSHVIKTIRIFDQEGTSATLGGSASRSPSSWNARRTSSSTNHTNLTNKAQPSSSERQTLEAKEADQQRLGLDPRDCPPTETNCSSNDVDWELVFHQLRKRFDLREEYADCLLLCRHCRCLFWKSIGHPCIKSDEERANKARQSGQNTDRSGQPAWEANQRPSNAAGRPSVASLSRSFDNRARVDEAENAPAPQRNSNSLRGQSGENRHPFANRDMQNANQFAMRRQQNASQQQPKTLNREELVPKHITITPQAFLKFFSL